MGQGSSRRHVMLGAVALGVAGVGVTGAASAQPQVRRDLYNGELDYLAKEYSGRAEDLRSRTEIAGLREPVECMAISGRCLSWQDGKPAAGVIV